jgi:gamma-glutamyltranspeptidase/glutathione hydrolase
VCESPLTGPGGGGFLLVHHAEPARTQLLDFFVAFPEQAGSSDELIGVVVDYGDSQQTFFTGPTSVAVPGVVLGLGEAHSRWGSMPWAELLAPAAHLAREGVVLNEVQAFLHLILDGLLRYSPEGDALYGPGRPLELGERLVMRELADTLDRLAIEGADSFYRGELAERVAAHVPITVEDLARYEVIERPPLAASFRGAELRTNPPPSGAVAVPPRDRSGPRRQARSGSSRMEAQDAMRRGGGRRRPTSVPSTATETPRLSPARSARRAASSFRAPASSSTTCSASFTSSASSTRARG